MMKIVDHPDLEGIELSTVLQALSDPIRLRIVRLLAECGETCCSGCGLDLPKATQSHHFKVLREAGVVAVRIEGTQRCLSLRVEEMNQRFPGLLDAVLKAQGPL
jgi:DNA-binding transcriptional ArsR family regulator